VYYEDTVEEQQKNPTENPNSIMPPFLSKTSNYKRKHQSTRTFIICVLKFSLLFVVSIAQEEQNQMKTLLLMFPSLTYLS